VHQYGAVVVVVDGVRACGCGAALRRLLALQQLELLVDVNSPVILLLLVLVD